ncbi:CobW/HypB/UreG, nucleotide-binding domain-containing protein [Paraphysoderma sedebokerense]|nr:CobW/HypB/UreG, nucleotide-binding domain-containing protein [Paraphysoderma sedebokerense]
MLNGCLCCVLVGQMKNALLEMKEKFNPDRIIIESSGSAFPAPIAWQINQLRNEGAGVHLDSIITVIDCVNFRGYEDTSYTAKLQAQYTDLLLLNKSELITPRQLDDVLDHVYALNEDTPVIYYLKDKGIDVDLFFGLDSKLIGNESKSRASSLGIAGAYNDENAHGHMNREVDLVLVKKQIDNSKQNVGRFDWGELFTIEQLENWLGTLSKESVYRVKGVIRVESPRSFSSPVYSGLNYSENRPTALLIVNHAFGRTQFTTIQSTETLQKYRDTVMKLTFMGVEFGFSRLVDKIEKELVKISEGEAGKAVEDFHIEVRLVEAHK